MQQELLLGGALANLRGGATTTDLLMFLADEADGIELYRLQPTRGSVKAALDWQAIVGTASSVVTLAGALWAGYQKFVKPQRDKEPHSTAGLFIQVRDRDGRAVQFFLGEEYKEKDIFLQSFTEKVEALREAVDSDGMKTQIRQEFERSGVWVRFK